MRYQILEQSESGQPWRFYAHGARYDKGEAPGAIAAIEARGGRAKLVPCGREAKRPPALPVLVLNTTRACYWRLASGCYVTAAPWESAEDLRRLVGGYPRLDSLMTLKGERPETIARTCDESGQARESGK